MTLEKPAGTASKLGTYELLKEQPGIGVGATWIARAAGDTAEAPKLFSLLRVHKHLTKKPETAAAFAADTEPATSFRHPNVATLVEIGNEAGETFVVSEHHDGETLAGLIAAAGAQGLPQPVVLRIGLDVLGALAAAHAHDPPLAHGELGPQSVLVGDDGVARLTGLVTGRALSRVTPPVGARNHDRLSYAAPERVKGLSTPAGAPAEPRADVFSIGVILWEALAHQRLFTSKIEAAIVQKVLTAPIAALGTLPGVTVAAPLAEAVQKALERDPAKRTATAGEIRDAIEALGADAVATAEQVAAEVERLAGKTISTRKADVRAEITRRRSNKVGTIPPPAPPKPAGGPTRKATLLGISVMKPATPAIPEAPRLPTPPAEPTPSPKPAEAKAPAAETPRPVLDLGPLPRPPAESINLEEIEVVAKAPPGPPPPPKHHRATLLMGTAAIKPPVTMGETPKPPEKRKETPKPFAAVVAPKPAEEKPAAAPAPTAEAASASPQPGLASAQALLEAASGKTHTPASDGPSPRSKTGIAVEKVGPGSTLGRYEILMPVARGGMASVWAAKLPGSRGFQKIFAIKTMLPDVSDDPDFEQMFLDEGKVAARIRHPNVVEIIDLGEQDDVLYLVMEWVEGDNLGSLVKAARAHGGVPMPIILRIASQVCAGLHAAHELRDDDGSLLDLVHRDISPANVLVSTSGFLKIVDFGIAKSKARLHVTRVGGMVKGKTPYLSPEQLGQQPIDRRSDIFSLGCMLYVLATGLHPFRGETDSKTIENIALREPVPLGAIAPGTPAELEAVVLKALSKDPKDRFATAAEMQRAVDHVAAALGLTTTEEDVAAFVRKALGDTLSKRAHDLRAAVERAESATPRPGADGPLPLEALAGVTGSTPKPRSAPAAATPAAAPAETPKPPPKPPAPKPRTEAGAAGLPPPPAPEPAGAKAAGAAASGAKPKVPAEPIEEEISFVESTSAAPEPSAIAAKPAALDGGEGPALAVAGLPKPKKPEAETLPEILPPPPEADEGPDIPPAREESSSRPVMRSDADAALELEGLPRKRKPMAMIAVGAVVGLCAVVGVAALVSGGKKDTANKAPPTPTLAAAPVGQAASPTPAPTEAPTAAQTAPAETTAPPPTAAPEPAKPPEPAATTAEAPTPSPVAVRPTRGTNRTTPPVKPPPGGGGTSKTKTTKTKPYNPGTL